MKRFALVLLIAFANLGQAPAVKGGTVTGSVTTVVKGKATKIEFDAYVYLERTTPERLLVGKDVVARIVQKDEKFEPAITVIPRGAKIFFPNRDEQKHSVFSPAAKMNNWYGFDLGKYGTDERGRNQVFPDAGEFDLYCDVHKDMWAKVKVVPTRYFTKVVDGKFTLTDIPPGTYRVIAWLPDSLESKAGQPLAVEPEKTVEAEALNVQYSPKTRVHPRRDGSDYGPYVER